MHESARSGHIQTLWEMISPLGRLLTANSASEGMLSTARTIRTPYTEFQDEEGCWESGTRAVRLLFGSIWAPSFQPGLC